MSGVSDGRAGGSGARAVVLARRRATTAGHSECEVHLVPLPLRKGDTRRDTVSAMCGRRLSAGHLETVTPGEGRWCIPCFVAHVLGGPSAAAPAAVPDHTVGDSAGRTTVGIDTVAGRLAVGVAYQRLGWPVTVRRHDVTMNLDLDVDAVALLIPAVLATEVAEILIRRRCPPPVLAHPAVPTHRVIVAGQRYPVPLGWPDGVHPVTGTLLLPPTVTVWGPVSWIRPPVPHALRLCREIDVLAALRTALGGPPAAAP